MCENDVTDEKIFGLLDKIASYERLLIELCAIIQDGHMQLTKTQYNSGTRPSRVGKIQCTLLALKSPALLDKNFPKLFVHGAGEKRPWKIKAGEIKRPGKNRPVKIRPDKIFGQLI